MFKEEKKRVAQVSKRICIHRLYSKIATKSLKDFLYDPCPRVGKLMPLFFPYADC